MPENILFVGCLPTLAAAIRSATVGHVQTCRNNEAAICETIDACTTAAEVLAVDLDAGWPA